MAKVGISAAEFKILTQHFKAPKEGEHICWKDFVDYVDEVFTKKGLEKSVDIVLNDVRTSFVYDKREATSEERNIVADIVSRFQDVVRKNRLDAKSFF